jgi:hypothetical protein
LVQRHTEELEGGRAGSTGNAKRRHEKSRRCVLGVRYGRGTGSTLQASAYCKDTLWVLPARRN